MNNTITVLSAVSISAILIAYLEFRRVIRSLKDQHSREIFVWMQSVDRHVDQTTVLRKALRAADRKVR